MSYFCLMRLSAFISPSYRNKLPFAEFDQPPFVTVAKRKVNPTWLADPSFLADVERSGDTLEHSLDPETGSQVVLRVSADMHRIEYVKAISTQNLRPTFMSVKEGDVKPSWEVASPFLVHLAQRCWRHNPAERPPMKEVVRLLEARCLEVGLTLPLQPAEEDLSAGRAELDSLPHLSVTRHHLVVAPPKDTPLIQVIKDIHPGMT